MSHKCSNCGTRGHRATYCPKCMVIYRKVVRFVKLKDFKDFTKAHNTPAGTTYSIIIPDAEVVQWLTKRGKMPDMMARSYEATVRSLRSVINAG